MKHFINDDDSTIWAGATRARRIEMVIALSVLTILMIAAICVIPSRIF